MDNPAVPKKALVCVHQRLTEAKASCGGRGGERIAEQLEEALAREQLDFPVERFICFGQCEEGPNIRLAPGGRFFSRVSPEALPDILLAIRQFLEINNS